MSEAAMAALIGFAPGAVGGVCNTVVGHPLDLIKVRQQTAAVKTTMTTAPPATTVRHTPSANYNVASLSKCSASTVGMLRRILFQEGVRGLYRGVSAPLVAVVPAFAVTFWSYDLAKRLQQRQRGDKKNAHLSIGQIGLAGGFSGIPLALVVGPLERLKCLMQVDPKRYNGFIDCLRQVYREGGLRSVLRGTGLTILRDVPGNAAYFACYEFWRRTLCDLQGLDWEKPSMATTLLAGGMAGVGNWIIAIPMDVLKSRWQTAAPGTYSNIGEVLTTLLRTEGPASLFRGLAPALMRAFPANAACLLGVETARSVLVLQQ